MVIPGLTHKPAAPEERLRARVVISGRVQGVFFRVETQRHARRAGVGGWVCNLPDGSVEAVFEGSPGDVDKMIKWCGSGPPMARVDSVKVYWEQLTKETRETSFLIR